VSLRPTGLAAREQGDRMGASQINAFEASIGRKRHVTRTFARGRGRAGVLPSWALRLALGGDFRAQDAQKAHRYPAHRPGRGAHGGSEPMARLLRSLHVHRRLGSHHSGPGEAGQAVPATSAHRPGALGRAATLPHRPHRGRAQPLGAGRTGVSKLAALFAPLLQGEPLTAETRGAVSAEASPIRSRAPGSRPQH
jgi:hypothetical protein